MWRRDAVHEPYYIDFASATCSTKIENFIFSAETVSGFGAARKHFVAGGFLVFGFFLLDFVN